MFAVLILLAALGLLFISAAVVVHVYRLRTDHEYRFKATEGMGLAEVEKLSTRPAEL